jgi:lipopolysaccharide transport system permease protein
VRIPTLPAVPGGRAALGDCLVDHANPPITKTVFQPRRSVSIFISSLFGHLMSLPLLVAAVAVVLKHFSVMVLLLPVYMVLLGLFAVGVGWLVSSLHVLRDTAQIVTVVLTLWFWLTPIFISEQLYPPGVRFLLVWNPLAYLVRSYRDRMLSFRLPTVEELAVPAAIGVAVFLLGGLTFRHLKRGFADVL